MCVQAGRSDKALPSYAHSLQPAYSTAPSDPPSSLKSYKSSHSAPELSMAPWHSKYQDVAVSASRSSPCYFLPLPTSTPHPRFSRTAH